MNLRNIIFATLLAALGTPLAAQNVESRPGSRWWWLGSAVSEAGLTANLEEYARKGIGALEVTPIYGVQGADSACVDYLSPRWMELLRHAEAEAARLGLQIDMNGGTGWPFGGPQVAPSQGAAKLVVEEYRLGKGERLAACVRPADPKQANAVLERLMAFDDKGRATDLTPRVDASGRLDWRAPRASRLIARFCGRTNQQVKRAAPGGEGRVVDHFSAEAVARYLARFDSAFAASGTPMPHNFFCDSYEVYGADWTPGLLEQFARRRGYRLECFLPQFLGEATGDTTRRLVADYRLTLGELLRENFTEQWTAWAHRRGAQTRNQAHGSPANLIDLYAAADVPECESFGISDFGIKGLHRDTLFKANDADMTMLKYASSAAHVAGRPLTSSETLTWLTEHFRTSLAQCKPDIDLMLLAGVNHLFFHGTPYTPPGDAWPGNLFYAAVNMSPTNTIWNDAEALFAYIARCQSYLQQGSPDNDFLVYYPYDDIISEQGGRLLLFDIHKMKQRAPRFIESVSAILDAGYDVDYISDALLAACRVDSAGALVAPSGVAYKGLIIPAVRRMEPPVLARIRALAEQGARVLFVGSYPSDVTGFGQLDARRKALRRELARFAPFASPDGEGGGCASQPMGRGTVLTAHQLSLALPQLGAKPETMQAQLGLRCIRRRDGALTRYFISALSPRDVDGWVPLAVPMADILLTNPLDGTAGLARSRQTPDGTTEVYLQLKSGESVLLSGRRLDASPKDSLEPAIADAAASAQPYPYFGAATLTLPLERGWTLSFPQSEPAIADTFAVDTLGSWTALPLAAASINRGIGRYAVTFELPTLPDPSRHYLLRLGDVCASARVRLNGVEAGIAWSAPFELRIPAQLLRPGANRLEVDVTNLPANSIADYDRRGVGWRKFNEINMVNIRYEKGDYSRWDVLSSGLLGPVCLTVD
jgi:hypothetical protein